ncbi:hypothetical protein QAD02_023015 [Eretmocerus hayati]|uniref:Uncharacterized protein n=1 Tax=Eretmocerus hayati TaxID=131215 RepID=A0ACC2PWS0_9HYME|nr:hypothetical protein QAD02_023015 [Eretmocerus hayati]
MAGGILMWLSVALLMVGVCVGQKPLNLGAKRRDLYIAGLFPYARHVPEGVIGRGVMPSVELAIQHINENPNYLRNFRLHMWANDTQCRVQDSERENVRALARNKQRKATRQRVAAFMWVNHNPVYSENRNVVS